MKCLALALAAGSPGTLKPGRYKILVCCERCGGSLIIAGSDDNGQTLHVIR